MYLNKGSEKKLLHSLLSPPYSIRIQILAVFGIGICPNLFPETDRGLDPILLLVIPTWMLLIISYVWPFLRTPRKDELATVLGINFTLRKQLVKKFVNQKIVEGGIIAFFGFTLYCLVRYYRMEVKFIDTSMQIGLFSFFEIPMMYILMNIFIQFADRMPTRKDCKRNEYFDLSSDRMARVVFNIYKRISFYFSSFATASVRPILRRHWLYTLRLDIFKQCILTVIIISIAFLSNFITTAEISITIQLFSFIVTLYLLTTLFDEANKSKKQCHYYTVEDKIYTVASMFYLLQIAVPFFIASIIAVMYSQQNRFALLFNVILLYFASVLSFTIRWNIGTWDNKSKAKLIVLCLFVLTSLQYILDKKLVIAFIIAVTSVSIEVFDLLKCFSSLKKYMKCSTKIIVFISGFVLMLLSLFWIVFIFTEPLYRPKFVNTYAERSVVLSVNSFCPNDSLTTILQQFQGHWNLNYDKNIEPQPWIIKDSLLSIYDEDNGTRSEIAAKMFVIDKHCYINCYTLPNKSFKKNQYAHMFDLPIHTLLRISINDNSILIVESLNPHTLLQIIKGDSLSSKYTIKANKYVFIYSENEWLNILKKYAVRDNLFTVMNSFTRVR